MPNAKRPMASPNAVVVQVVPRNKTVTMNQRKPLIGARCGVKELSVERMYRLHQSCATSIGTHAAADT